MFVIMNTEAREFTKWLEAELEDRGWSQRHLAALAGLSETTVSNWMNEHQPPSRRSARAIAEALGIDETIVFEKAGIPPRATRQTYAADTRRHVVGAPGIPVRQGVQVSISESDRPVRGVESLTTVPVLGRAPADYPRWTAAQEPADLLPTRDLSSIQQPALVIASGDCLIERGIQNGTRVLIDRAATPMKKGEIVVMRIEDEVTMKEWHPLNDDTIALRASNDRYPPIYIRHDQENVELIGVARLYYRVSRL